MLSGNGYLFRISVLRDYGIHRSPFFTKKRGHTMQILDRLKMELSNQKYFPDEQYIQFLTENGLDCIDRV